jgi:hypothetical protein
MDLELGDVDVRFHHANVKNAINTNSIGKWRKHFNAREIAKLNQKMGPLLDTLGYER